MSESSSNKNYIVILVVVIVLCAAAIYFFAIRSSVLETTTKVTNNENSNTNDEIKRKELELKERELALKEKEFGNKNSSSGSFVFSTTSLNNFVNDWVSYQNSKNYSAYINCYSSDFNGVKRTKSGKTTNFNYSEWTQDRIKMYSSATNLFISTSDFEVKQINNSSQAAVVLFMQYYSSDNYQDEGKKMLKIRNENGAFKIYYEELFYSTDVINENEGC